MIKNETDKKERICKVGPKGTTIIAHSTVPFATNKWKKLNQEKVRDFIIFIILLFYYFNPQRRDSPQVILYKDIV